jgi:hypothetical protein
MPARPDHDGASAPGLGDDRLRGGLVEDHDVRSRPSGSQSAPGRGAGAVQALVDRCPDRGWPVGHHHRPGPGHDTLGL